MSWTVPGWPYADGGCSEGSKSSTQCGSVSSDGWQCAASLLRGRATFSEAFNALPTQQLTSNRDRELHVPRVRQR